MDDATHNLILRLHEVVDRLEALAQERRPVAAVQTPRGTEYAYSDGTRMLWQVDPDGAYMSEWAELPPLPGTRRDGERDSVAGDCTKCGGPVYHREGKPGEFDHECPADYSDALDRTAALAAVVEAAQKVLPRMVEGHWQVPIHEQHLVLELEAALDDLGRQQGEAEGGSDG